MLLAHPLRSTAGFTSSTGRSGVKGAPFLAKAPVLASLRDGFATLDSSR